ncbi:oplophorus-luciferin 2-monooxygenase non-catalytic subunit-like [Rhipicephalus sanguineus]|uniref:oplophorus-luciferin 2-monooxygenase non-catalytic subunit-like n=1 Tax=Rhipicephalus sanguineus TaxID=34632 RepID=UPI001894F65C|nr:oplophorus-luciferin 2-monooxygenase non-catalytic subunit-like [Rhipicephalus sanguineus]
MLSGTLLVTLAAFAVAGAEPTCNETLRQGYRVQQIHCTGFDNPEQLWNAVPRDLDLPKTRLVLRDSVLSYFLPQTFVGTNATYLKLSNVTVGRYVRGWLQRYYPFEGLEDTLEVFELADDSTFPSSWTLLSDMHSLTELRLVNMNGLKLSSNFAQLPRTLSHVAVIRSTIESVDDDWLASLTNLEKVSVIKCNLVKFSRTMLPRPAAKLWRLILDHANLTSLPLDFAEELPELKEVGLRHNFITSFRAATLLPLARNGTRVSLVGNPLTCDCKAAFLLDLPEDWHYPKCAAPDSLLNRNIKELTTVQLGCDAIAGGPFVEATSTEEGNETS